MILILYPPIHRNISNKLHKYLSYLFVRLWTQPLLPTKRKKAVQIDRGRKTRNNGDTFMDIFLLHKNIFQKVAIIYNTLMLLYKVI